MTFSGSECLIDYMRKAKDNTTQFQFDLFEPADNLIKTNTLNKDCPAESNLDEDNNEVNFAEKSFSYTIGNKENSFMLTYIDYDCPQALKAHETVMESLNRLNEK